MTYDTFDETITVYNKYTDKEKKATAYKGIHIKKCSWYGKVAVNVDSNGVSSASLFKVRVRERDLPEGYVSPDVFDGIGYTFANGDIVIKGEHPLTVSKIADITNKNDSFKVLGVHMNTKGIKPLRHVMIEGS